MAQKLQLSWGPRKRKQKKRAQLRWFQWTSSCLGYQVRRTRTIGGVDVPNSDFIALRAIRQRYDGDGSLVKWQLLGFPKHRFRTLAAAQRACQRHLKSLLAANKG